MTGRPQPRPGDRRRTLPEWRLARERTALTCLIVLGFSFVLLPWAHARFHRNDHTHLPGGGIVYHEAEHQHVAGSHDDHHAHEGAGSQADTDQAPPDGPEPEGPSPVPHGRDLLHFAPSALPTAGAVLAEPTAVLSVPLCPSEAQPVQQHRWCNARPRAPPT